MTGANHVLPTGGLARSYSGLSTLDFVRWTTYQRVTRRRRGATGRAMSLRSPTPKGCRRTRRGAARAGAADGRHDRQRPPRAARATMRRSAVRARTRAVRASTSATTRTVGARRPRRCGALRELAATTDPLSRRSTPRRSRGARAVRGRARRRGGHRLRLGRRARLRDARVRRAGRRIAYSAPTFAMIPVFARMNGLEPRRRAAARRLRRRLDALLATRREDHLPVLAEQSDRHRVSRAAVERVVEHAAGIVIIDEAYAEFAAGRAAIEPRAVAASGCSSRARSPRRSGSPACASATPSGGADARRRGREVRAGRTR